MPVLFASILTTGVLDRAVIHLPPNGLRPAKASSGEDAAGKHHAGKDTKEKDQSAAGSKGIQPPHLGMGIEARTGGYKNSLSTERIEPTSSLIAPEGLSWAVLSTDRDVKKEISANLRTTLNVSVNLPYTAPFLSDVKVTESIVTIILRWTSSTLKRKLEEKDLKEPEPSLMSDASKELGDYFIRSLTSQAWIVGIWKVEQGKQMSKDNYESLRQGIVKHFGEPQEIEEGCDYLDNVTKARLEDDQLIAGFKLYGSDGFQINEIPVLVDWISPTNAFDAISRRKRLSSINYLHISGEIEATKGAAPPQLNERALMQIQEAWGSILFLKAKGKSAKSWKKKLQYSYDNWLFGSKPFDTGILAELDRQEWALKE